MTAALPNPPGAGRNEPVPLAFARALLFTAREQGLDVAALLAEAAFPFDPCAPPAQPCFVSVEQYSRLCVCLFKAMDDESGGIMPANGARFGSTRLLLHSVLRCQSLQDVLNRAAEFNHCCLERSTERGVWLETDAGAGLARLNYRPSQVVGAGGSPEGVLCGMSMWLRLCSWLIGQPIDVLSATCAGSRPGSMLSLRHFFHCPVEFGGEHHSVCFSACHLAAPIVRSETELAAFLPIAPYHLVIKPVVSDSSISTRIQQKLGVDLLEPPGFEALTGMLNMSARTLRRRLEKEGTSYQRIKDNTRRDAAISLLSRTRLPIAEIAVLVGFSDPSAFHRSFKKWTGLAPGEYR